VIVYLAGMKSQFFTEIMTCCDCLHMGLYFHSNPFYFCVDHMLIKSCLDVRRKRHVNEYEEHVEHEDA